MSCSVWVEQDSTRNAQKCFLTSLFPLEDFFTAPAMITMMKTGSPTTMEMFLPNTSKPDILNALEDMRDGVYETDAENDYELKGHIIFKRLHL